MTSNLKKLNILFGSVKTLLPDGYVNKKIGCRATHAYVPRVSNTYNHSATWESHSFTKSMLTRSPVFSFFEYAFLIVHEFYTLRLI